MNIMLHICCAPCAMGVLKSIPQKDGYKVTGYYYNPNIHPIQEFDARRMSVEALSGDNEFPVIYDDEMMQEYWKKSLHGEKEKRCGVCYALRTKQIAKTAKEKGMDAFTTTLLISPWQDHERIRALGEAASAKYDIPFFYKDFRPFYREGKNEAYNRGYYLQKYCGCIFSYQESDHRKKPEYEF